MRRLVLLLFLVAGGLTAAMVYEQVFVDKTFGPSAMLGVSVLGFLSVALLATYLLYGTRYQETIGNLWVAGVSVTVSFLFLDFVAGLFLIRPLSPPLVPDVYRHHRLVPNSHAEFQQPEFSYVQRVNTFGLRGREVSVEKPPGRIRIVMLGDSFTMGKGVEDDQTFSVLLERVLNQAVAGCQGRSVEVLNAGVDSYAPILSYIQLKRSLQSLHPDLVVLNLDVSDLVQEAQYRRIAVRDADGDIIGVPNYPERASPIERVRAWTERHMFFTRLALYHTNRLLDYKDLTVRDVLTKANLELAMHTLAEDRQPREEQWRDVFDSIGRIKAYCEGRGMAFLLTVYPWAHQVSDTEWIPGRYTFMPKGAVASDRSVKTVWRLAVEHGVDLVDLYPVFRTHKGTKALYFQRDMHWTPAGHEVVASGLHEQLVKRYLQQWCGPRQGEGSSHAESGLTSFSHS